MPLPFIRLTAAALLAPVLALAPAEAAGQPAPSSVPSAEAALVPARPEPLGAGADMADGYAGRVLETLLPFWEPPAGASGVVQVALRLSSEGRLLFCETRHGSGNAELDESPCLAALKPPTFGVPPYGAVTEVYLTLATDRAALLTGAPSTAGGPGADLPGASYAERVMRAVRPRVQVPPRLGGSFTVEVDVQIVDNKGSGGVHQITVSRPSGRADVDAAVLAAVSAPGVLPAPPQGRAEVRLSFTVQSN